MNSLNIVHQDELTIYQKFTVSKSFPLNFILQNGLKMRELHGHETYMKISKYM